MEVAMVLAVLWSRYGQMQLTDMWVAGFRQSWYLVRKRDAFIKNEAKVTSRVSCVKWTVCCLSAVRRNSVLDELRVKRLAVINKEILLFWYNCSSMSHQLLIRRVTAVITEFTGISNSLNSLQHSNISNHKFLLQFNSSPLTWRFLQKTSVDWRHSPISN